MFKLSGYDHCLVGLVSGANAESRLCYSVDLVIRTLCKMHDISEASAYQFFIDNLLQADLGDEGPVFLERCSISDIEQHDTRLMAIMDSIQEGTH